MMVYIHCGLGTERRMSLCRAITQATKSHNKPAMLHHRPHRYDAVSTGVDILGWRDASRRILLRDCSTSYRMPFTAQRSCASGLLYHIGSVGVAMHLPSNSSPRPGRSYLPAEPRKCRAGASPYLSKDPTLMCPSMMILVRERVARNDSTSLLWCKDL